MKALIIGGTGPTGPHLISGLNKRGYDVTIFHRGTHEPADLPPARHIHGDPHFRETIDEALGSEEFDVVVAAYGRVRLLAEALAGRCSQFLSVGGVPVYAGWYEPTTVLPYGTPLPTRESDRLASALDKSDLPSLKFAQLMVRTEEAVWQNHPTAAVFRYPMIYGPNNPMPWEWMVIKRLLDSRPHMILPDGGIAIYHRCAARNAAEFLLRAVDNPEAAAGEAFNVGDEVLWTTRQWVELVMERVGRTMELVPLPSDIAVGAAAALSPQATPLSPHKILSVDKARQLLGYRDVVDPVTALGELVDWYLEHPVQDTTTIPAFIDPFDYALEDRLITAYARTRGELVREHPQVVGDGVHGMPHPKVPGGADSRGR